MAISSRATWALLGVAVGVAATMLVYQLRGGGGGRAAPGPAGGSGGSSALGGGSGGGSGEPAPRAGVAGAEARAQEIARLRDRIAELEAADRGGGIGGRDLDLEHGLNTDDAWWARMPRDPAWDRAQEQKVVDRMARYVGVRVDPAQVECRTRCCRVQIDEESYDRYGADLHSSVGLRFAPPDGWATSHPAPGEVMVTTCWRADPSGAPIPDRALERDAILAAVAEALRRCGEGVSHPLTLRLVIELDEQGEIEKVDSNQEELGHPAAACAEAAILGAAQFDPAPMPTDVPFTIALGG